MKVKIFSTILLLGSIVGCEAHQTAIQASLTQPMAPEPSLVQPELKEASKPAVKKPLKKKNSAPQKAAPAVQTFLEDTVSKPLLNVSVEKLPQDSEAAEKLKRFNLKKNPVVMRLERGPLQASKSAGKPYKNILEIIAEGYTYNF